MAMNDKQGGRRGEGEAGAVPASMLNYAAGSSPRGPSNLGSAPGFERRVAPAIYFSGLFCLAVAVIMTIVLIISHFDVMALPGCGQGGGCAEVTRGYWGKVPGTSYPVSFVGFAYFTGLLLAWTLSRGGVPEIFKLLVRFGVLLSLAFIGIMLASGHICWYCLVTHVANIAFWALIEFAGVPSAASLRSIGAVMGVFVVASGILYGIDKSRSAHLVAERNKQADEDVKRIVEQSQTTKPVEPVVITNVSPTTDTEQPVQKQPPFTGRYRIGPEAAPVRMLMITDYQCPDCRAVENVARRIVEQHKNVSLSIKHFPMDANCNRNFQQSMHPNACWAARAAETAGLLHGNDGFWQMHHWLFERKGAFTDAELNTGLTELGFNPAEFIPIMTSPQTEELVKADIEEAIDVGLFFTPMIFINGVHLRGVFEQNADKLRQSVEVLLSQNLPALTAEADQKPTALETMLGDHRDEFARNLPADPHPWLRGPAAARLKIVVWGDYQEQWTSVVDRAIVQWIADKPDVSYTYRHFPFNQECNSVVTRTAFPHSCLAARAAEAAGVVGGSDGFWKMHDWLMTNREQVNDQTVGMAAAQLGFDSAAFAAAMTSPAVASIIEEDCKGAKPTKDGSFSYLFRGGIPTVYVNGKAVPRWRKQDTVIIDKILDMDYAALNQPAATSP